MKNTDYIKHIKIIVQKMKVGQISYDEAATQAKPHIEKMNEAAAKIAKEYGRTPPKFSFSKLARQF